MFNLVLLFSIVRAHAQEVETWGEATPFPVGAIPSDPEMIAATPQFSAPIAGPKELAVVPRDLQYWGNNRYGICVTSEEAFARLAYGVMCDDSEIRVSDSDCIAWARARGFLNGAPLLGVMKSAARDGLVANGREYKTGEPHRVNWKDEAELKAAIAAGPVKLGMQHGDLPKTAGGKNGWWIVKPVPGGRYDHCVSLCGYGSAKFCFDALNMELPSGLEPDQQGYLLFTWGSIGFVSHDWLVNAVDEAYVRTPTCDGVRPNPEPRPRPILDTLSVIRSIMYAGVLIIVGMVAMHLLRKFSK